MGGSPESSAVATERAGFGRVLTLLASVIWACGARSALELDTSAGSQTTGAAAGSSAAGATGAMSSSGAAGHGEMMQAIVACPSPGSADEAYDVISGSPCDEPDDFSCRGSDSCSPVCNCIPPPNNECESNTIPVWECNEFTICGRPIGCPSDGAVEIAYNAIAGLPCAPEGTACAYCTCMHDNGSLRWACSLPICY